LLDSWHKAAAEAKFDAYFDKMTEDAVFIGTDATEKQTRLSRIC
jgi:ketosteroid isomerase-like protein